VSHKAHRLNGGKARWSLIPFFCLVPLVRVLEFGAQKYSPFNWTRGFPEKELLDSAMRHLASLMDGEWTDQESGLPHAGHVMANMIFIIYQRLDGRPRNDDGTINE
jgi:hypothetical protein